jgi:hypothetical protein
MHNMGAAKPNDGFPIVMKRNLRAEVHDLPQQCFNHVFPKLAVQHDF